MTKPEDKLRMKPSTERRIGETDAEKRERYAHNALVEADLARSRARAERRAVKLIQGAAQNARRNGDLIGADLYDDMAEAATDIAEGQEDKAQAARAVAEHYARRPEQP